MRAILDTNVIVSAVLVAGSAPDAAMRSAFDAGFGLVTSPPLAELSRVLQRQAILSGLGWAASDVYDFVATVERNAIVVYPDIEIDLLADYDDNLIEAAVASGAAYIVTATARCSNSRPMRPPKLCHRLDLSRFLRLNERGRPQGQRARPSRPAASGWPVMRLAF